MLIKGESPCTRIRRGRAVRIVFLSPLDRLRSTSIIYQTRIVRFLRSTENALPKAIGGYLTCEHVTEARALLHGEGEGASSPVGGGGGDQIRVMSFGRPGIKSPARSPKADQVKSFVSSSTRSDPA